MRIFVTTIISLTFLSAHGQSKPSNLIEGAKTLTELIKVFKSPRNNTTASFAQNGTTKNSNDSCEVKQKSDLCFKNSSTKDLAISIYKRTETGYESLPFTMKVITKRQECWYELRAGIYKYKIEIDSGTQKIVFSEGELKLQPCDNMQREITE